MIRLPNPFAKRRLTRLQKAERVSPLCVASQDIGHVRKRKVRATINGLLSVVAPEKAEDIRAQLAAAQAEASR